MRKTTYEGKARALEQIARKMIGNKDYSRDASANRQRRLLNVADGLFKVSKQVREENGRYALIAAKLYDQVGKGDEYSPVIENLRRILIVDEQGSSNGGIRKYLRERAPKWETFARTSVFILLGLSAFSLFSLPNFTGNSISNFTSANSKLFGFLFAFCALICVYLLERIKI